VGRKACVRNLSSLAISMLYYVFPSILFLMYIIIPKALIGKSLVDWLSNKHGRLYHGLHSFLLPFFKRVASELYIYIYLSNKADCNESILLLEFWFNWLVCVRVSFPLVIQRNRWLCSMVMMVFEIANKAAKWLCIAIFQPI